MPQLSVKQTLHVWVIFVAAILSASAPVQAQDKAWAQRFTPGAPPPEYVTERDYDQYFSQLCRSVILPQWQPSSDAQSAVTQMNALMGQIGARFEGQADIDHGYAAYYYKTNKPVDPRLSTPFFSLFSKKDPGAVEHLDLRETALHYKATYNFDAAEPKINTMPDGLTQVMFSFYKAKGLQAFWETKELINPPSFLPKIFQVSPMGFPKEWEYQSSERRDAFSYQYYYKYPPLADPSQLGPQHGRVILRFDGRRTENGALENIVLRDISCNITGGPEFEHVTEIMPRPPIIMQDCRAYKNWYSCHFNRKGTVSNNFCDNYPKEEPVCGVGE